MTNINTQVVTCYACPRPATTKCHSCNACSCVQHIDARVIRLGKSKSHALYCPKCFEEYEEHHICRMHFQLFMFIVFAIAALVLLNG